MCQGKISIRLLTLNDNNVSFFSAFHPTFQGPLSSFPLSYVSPVLLRLIWAGGRQCARLCVCTKVHRALGGHQRLSERIKDPANLGKPGTHARTHSLASCQVFFRRILAVFALSFACFPQLIITNGRGHTAGRCPLHGPPSQSPSISARFVFFPSDLNDSISFSLYFLNVIHKKMSRLKCLKKSKKVNCTNNHKISKTRI